MGELFAFNKSDTARIVAGVEKAERITPPPAERNRFRPPDPQRWFWGRIVEAPEGEDEYTDHRYWVERVFVANDEADAEDAAAAVETATGDYAQTVTAANWGEEDNASHSLAVGQVVRVYYDYDRSSPDPAVRYTINLTPVAAYQGGAAEYDEDEDPAELIASNVTVFNISTDLDTSEILEFFADEIDVAPEGAEDPMMVKCLSLRFKTPPSGRVYLCAENGKVLWNRLEARDD